jgi:hypothetical protein
VAGRRRRSRQTVTEATALAATSQSVKATAEPVSTSQGAASGGARG